MNSFYTVIKSVVLFTVVFTMLYSCKEHDKKVATEKVAKVDTTAKKIDTVVKPKYPDYLTIDFLMGKFNPAKHKRFVRIEDKYTNKKNVYLDKDAYASFLKMYQAAYKDGFKLVIVSATRNFDYQKNIWERKWKQKAKIADKAKRTIEILKYSAMPGTSRHHWGTEVDLNVLENSFYTKGEGKKIFDWMMKNAHKYGFYRPYTAGRPYGYNEEKWHWSYTPVSKTYTKYAKENMKDKFISGFSGAETAKKIAVTKKYILGIDASCL